MSKLLNSIKHHEGFRSKVYKCSLNYDTIGYGSAIKDLVLDEDIASLILERKVDKLIKELDKKFDWYVDLPEEARDVVTGQNEHTRCLIPFGLDKHLNELKS